MKILLWKLGALGDVLMTTPLVRQLRRAWPQARIDYLVGESCAVMLRGNPRLDEVRTFDDAILIERRASRLPEIVRALRGFDIVFVLDKHWVFPPLAFAARVPTRVGFARRPFEGWLHTDRVPYGPLRHEIDYYLDLAAPAGARVDRDDRALELPPPQPCELPVGPYVVLVNAGGNNAGERSSVRRLPEPLFDALANHCARETRVVFVGTAAEAANYARFGGPAFDNLCGRLALPQVWWVLQHAQHVYATDCGLMHMAGAVNPHVTALLGPTHPMRVAPPGATWAWKDEAVLDERYRLFGVPPRGEFFRTLTLADILAAAGRAHNRTNPQEGPN